MKEYKMHELELKLFRNIYYNVNLRRRARDILILWLLIQPAIVHATVARDILITVSAK